MPQYFVIDESGEKHKIFWGFPGDESDVFSTKAEGMNIKVWFDDYYGVIQEYAVATEAMMDNKYQKNPNIEVDYAFFKKDYFYKLLTPIFCLSMFLYCLIQFARIRKQEKENKNATNI